MWTQASKDSQVSKRLAIFLIITSSASLVHTSVPASLSERLWEEIAGVKIVMTNIQGQLDKFNSLYLSKLEQRMVSMAASLASLDSNVKNLQDRAHVWDTFQHHVSAWNEQINTLDKKVEIISKGQEQVINLDQKMEAISNIEYKVERIIGKIDVTDSTLQSINKVLENHQNRDPLLSEFTSRGALSTLKIMERKMDRILTSVASTRKNVSSNQSKRNTTVSETDAKGKLLIRCNTPPIVEELLHDISSKVDVIFDKMSSSDRKTVEYVDDYQDYPTTGEESAHDLRVEPSDEKLIHNVWRKLTGPYKKTSKTIEVVENRLQSLENSTASILEITSKFNDQLQSRCLSSSKDIATYAETSDTLLRRVETISLTIERNEQQFISIIDSRFREQHNHLLANLKMYLTSVWDGTFGTKKSQITANTPIYGVETEFEKELESSTRTSPASSTSKQTENEFTSGLFDGMVQDCSLLSRGYPSGVYQLRARRQTNANGRSFYSRYCDMRTAGGGWTVIQRRGYFGEPVLNFSQSWNDYKYGFGSLEKEFWFGNEFIHLLTHDMDVVLRVELEDFNGNVAWAEYSLFKVASEENNYELTVAGYSGNASDSLSAHNKALFSTYDRDNDDAPPCCPCAPAYGGGWWFYSCFEANLNGIYYNDPKNNDYFRGIIWEHWLGNYSLKKTQMLIRPKRHSTDAEEFDRQSTVPLPRPEDP